MLHVHLFGHLRLFEDERALRFAALPRTLSLFAYLLLRRGEALPREALAFTLWPDVPEAEARANLRRHLHDLKRALPSNPPGAPYVVADTRTVQWNPTSLAWLDVAAFEGLCTDAGRYAEAVAVYTGDLLPDLYEDWVAPDRERLRQLYLTTLARLLDQHRTRQDYLQAIVYAQQILACEPLREDVARDLIALRAAAGEALWNFGRSPWFRPRSNVSRLRPSARRRCSTPACSSWIQPSSRSSGMTCRSRASSLWTCLA